MANQALRIALLLWILSACKNVEVIRPPRFPHERLMNEHYREARPGLFPLTVDTGKSRQATVSQDGLIYYSSDQDGARNIYVRDLNSTLQFPLLRHPAEQHSPAISPNGRILLFISEDKDRQGDLRALLIDSEEMVENVLTGAATPDIWRETINLTEYIRDYFASHPDPSCRGEASERYPAWHPDGERFFLVSNRCHPDREAIWQIRILTRALGLSIEIEKVGPGTLPAISRNGQFLAFIAYRATNSRGELFVRDLKTGTEERIPLPEGSLPLYPALDEDANTIYCSLVEKDSSGDGRLDANDRATLYALNRNGQARPLAETTGRIHSLTLAHLSRAFLILAGDILQDINLFLLPIEGTVKREASLDEQLQFTERMRRTNPARETIARQALDLWAESPDYELASAAASFQAELSGQRTNPRQTYAREMVEIARLPRSRAIARLEELARSGARRTGYLENLAFLYERERDPRALSVYRQLLKEKYYRRTHALKMAGDLSLATARSLPPEYLELIALDHPEPVKQDVLQRLIRSFRHYPELLQVQDDAPPDIKILPILFMALAEPSPDRAIELLKRTIEGSQSAVIKAEAYSRIAFLQDQAGQSDAALRSRQEYAKLSLSNSSTEEYQRLMASSQKAMDSYRSRARLLSRVASALPDEAFKDYKNYRIEPGTAAQKIMHALCDPSSRAAEIFPNLGPAFRAAYINYCQKIQTGITTELLTLATEASYIISYVTANDLNIFFLSLKQRGLHREFHLKYSPLFHRQKIDIAMERHRNVLAWEKRKKRIRKELESLLLETDPFDGATFLELEYGYRLTVDAAREAGDNSLLYGYAYTLIRKSAERERFYDELLSEGNVIPDSELIAKKHSVLKDLKTASLYLDYIQNTEPDFFDAYLLSGWLHNYLEYRKARPLARSFSRLEKTLRLLVPFTRSRKPDEGLFFYTVYNSYFPERLYEQNLRLWSRGLAIAEKNHAGPETLASLHLASANNYYNLQNFSRALSHYGRVDGFLARGVNPFDDYLGRSLFHFHFGRALHYQGQSNQAIGHLEQAHDLFFQHEYEPAEPRAPAQKDFFAILTGKEAPQAPRDIAARKLALIQAFLGMAHFEAGNFEKASQAYAMVHYRLQSLETPEESSITEAAIFNFQALSLQAMGNYDQSSALAREAATVSEALGLGQDRDPYLPASVISGILGFFLGYGEDFSVIGEGRTPYGFSALRQHHLSLGIQLENAMLLGNLQLAEALLRERLHQFEEREGKLELGRRGRIASHNQRGQVEWMKEKYLQASRAFLTAHELALSSGFENSAVVNLKNAFYALFAAWEASPVMPRERLGQEYSQRLEIFKKGYFALSKQQYIDQKKIEELQFEYDAVRDDPVVEAQLKRKLLPFLNIEASMLAYLSADASAEAGQSQLKRAAQHFREILTLREKAGDTRNPEYYRIQLNLGRVLEALGDSAAIDLYLDLAEATYEFNLPAEAFETQAALARIYTTRSDARSAGIAIEKALILLGQYPEVVQPLPFMDFAIAHYAGNGNLKKARSLLDDRLRIEAHDAILLRPYRSFALHVPELVQYRLQLAQLRETIREESSKRLQRQDPGAAQKKIEALRKSLSQLRQRLTEKIPLALDLFRTPVAGPVGARQARLQTFLYGDRLTVWLDGKKESALSGPWQTIFARLPQMIREQDAQELLLIAEDRSFTLPFHELFGPSDLSVTYLPDRSAAAPQGFLESLPASFDPENHFIFNVASQGGMGADILTDEPCPLRVRGSAILFLDQAPDHDYRSLRLCYLAARMAGTTTLLSGKGEGVGLVLKNAGKESYHKAAPFLMGVSGFLAKSLKERMTQAAHQYRICGNEALALGRTEEAAVCFSRAASIEKVEGNIQSATRLGLLRSALRLGRDNKLVDRLLSESGDEEDQARALEALLESGNEDWILRYQESIENRADKQTIAVIRFIYDLKRGRMTSSDLEQRWPAMQNAALTSRLRRQLARALFEHLQFTRGLKIAPELTEEARREDSILRSREPPPALPTDLLAGSAEFSAELGKQWTRYQAGEWIQTDLLHDRAVGRRSLHTTLSHLSRSALFTLFNQEYRQDADPKHSSTLLKFIQGERSADRQAHFALSALRTALFIEDFPAGKQFLEVYESAREKALAASGVQEAELYRSLLTELDPPPRGLKSDKPASVLSRIALSHQGLRELSEQLRVLNLDQVLILLNFLKPRLLRHNDPELLLSLVVWENELRSERRYRSYRPLSLSLPPLTRFLAMITVGEEVYELAYQDNRWKQSLLPASAFRLRNQLQQVTSRPGHESTGKARSELEDTGFALLADFKDTTYLWLPDRLLFLPLPVSQELTVYQVLDLRSFVSGPALPVEAVSAQNSMPGHISFAIAGAARVARYFSRLSDVEAGTEPYIVGESLLPDPGVNKRLQNLTAMRPGPGILTAWKMDEAQHAFFMKSYYDPTIHIRDPARRFSFALARLKDAFPDQLYYQYRLVTSRPVRP